MKYLIHWAVFLALVLSGLSLSNIGVMRGSELTHLVGGNCLAGMERPIRADEYAAHGLPPAIQQYNGAPRFQKINPRVGLSGRNYLLLHDTGAPVAHLAMVGRPAVWGFFFLDLRRSLSWFSLFPVFFAVFSFWFLFDTVWRENGWFNLFAALACAFTLNSSVWTFWPAYNVAGTMLALAAVLRLLDSERWSASLGWGALTGWGGLVSALTLYFPRVWLGVLLAGFLFAGVASERRLWLRLRSARRLASLGLGGALLLLVLAAWYAGCRDEIGLMSDSVYPGARRDLGGAFGLWQLCSGWLGMPMAFCNDFSPAFSNQCEIQEPLFVGAALAALVAFAWRRLEGKRLLAGALAGLVFLYGYGYCRMPGWFARITLLDHGNCIRADYFFSVAQIAVLCCLWRQGRIALSARQALLVQPLLLLPPVALFMAPDSAWPAFVGPRDPGTSLATVAAILILYWAVSLLLVLRFRLGAALFLAVELLPGLAFNPVGVAPAKLDSPLLSEVMSRKDDWRCEGRVLIVGSVWESTLYAAAGGTVLNGFFEYADPKLIEALSAQVPNAFELKRLHHLTVWFSPKKSPAVTLDVPSPNHVSLTLSGRAYDFGKLPVDFVVVQSPLEARLARRNPSLSELPQIGGWHCFQVVRRRPENGDDNAS